MSDLNVITKYRPQVFADVIGQDAVVRSLEAICKRRDTQVFLFSGPSGCGKTTLARIVAYEYGVEDKSVMEIDAASRTGIDDMRQLQEILLYRPFGDSGKRAVILDECFARGTLVDTPMGFRPIESLEKGDFVLSVNNTPRKILASIKRVVPKARIIKLCLSSGDAIICSKEHPFLTTEGWVCAEDLHEKDIIRTRETSIPLHLQKMWDQIYGYRTEAFLPRMLKTKLCYLQQYVFCQSPGHAKHMFETLWKQAWGQQKNRRTPTVLDRSSTSWAGTQSERKSRNVETRSKEVFSENAFQESYAQTRKYRKDDVHKSKQWDFENLEGRTGRKWSWTNKAASFVVFFGWGSVGIRHSNWEEKSGLAKLLQSRYWFSRTENLSGNRWQQSQSSFKPKIGRSQDFKTSRVRVENLSNKEWLDLEASKADSSIFGDSFEFHDLAIEGHPSFGVNGLVAHNCHALSKNAFDSLLKSLEDPPEHVVWFFCTTNPSKIPATLKTRCTKFELKEVPDKDLGTLYDFVCDEEKLDLPGDIGDLLIREAKGSPRQLLSNIVVARTARNKKEAAELLHTAIQTDATLELCQFIANGSGSWTKCMGLLNKLEDTNPEATRILVCNYLASCLKNAKSDDTAAKFAQRLDAFGTSYNSVEGQAPLLLSICRALFSE